MRLAMQGAVLAPASGDPAQGFDTGVDPVEQTKRPYLQARVRAAWGDDAGGGAARGEIGVGVHRGWLRRPDGTHMTSSAVAADATVRWARASSSARRRTTARRCAGSAAGGSART
ncbi:MAG TPA: hypothetical protein VK922_14265 [Gemmatimonadaceae bacterium]|nr:hypothetical protein [Gemmatimonadaceae bacterium]